MSPKKNFGLFNFEDFEQIKAYFGQYDKNGLVKKIKCLHLFFHKFSTRKQSPCKEKNIYILLKNRLNTSAFITKEKNILRNLKFPF